MAPNSKFYNIITVCKFTRLRITRLLDSWEMNAITIHSSFEIRLLKDSKFFFC